MHSAGIGKDKWHPEEVERRPHLESRRGTTERIQRRLNPNGAAGAAEGVRTAFDQTVTCSQIKQLFISPCSPCRGPCQLVANAPEAFPGRDSTVRLDTAPQLAARQRNAATESCRCEQDRAAIVYEVDPYLSHEFVRCRAERPTNTFGAHSRTSPSPAPQRRCVTRR